MEKPLFLILTFLFLSNIFGQNKLAIELNDGTVLDGFGRIKPDETILFKKTEDSEKEIYNYLKVEKLLIHYDDSIHEFEYKIIDGSAGNGSVKLFEIIKTGKVILYQDYISGMSYGQNMIGEYGFTRYSETIYYISVIDSDLVTSLRHGNTYSNRFKKIAQKYFVDCPDLMEKIKSKFFKRYDIHSIVDYYNEKCK